MTTRELLQMALDAIDERRSLSGETAKEYYVAHQIRAALSRGHCMCPACKDGALHWSDCAVHNEPAYPRGECDCGGAA